MQLYSYLYQMSHNLQWRAIFKRKLLHSGGKLKLYSFALGREAEHFT